MIKKILAPQDGSAHSASAIEYAIWLAKKFGANIAGLYVVDIVALEGPFLHDMSGSLGFEPYLNFSTKMREILEERGKSVLTNFQETCKKAGVVYDYHAVTGIVAREICNAAKLSDLVVMGSRGVNVKFDYGLLGSTTERVLRLSPEPVLVVPAEFNEPTKALLAYDGSIGASKAMHSAAQWAKALGISLTVLSVSAEAEKTLKEAQDYLKTYNVDATYEAQNGDPPIVIEKYFRDNDYDLLFMGATHRSKLLEMVVGSTAEHVMRHVRGPFLLDR